jgi:hypothetical protein
MPTPREIQKIKRRLEHAIARVKKILEAEGYDVNAPEFKERIKRLRQRILEDININPELYNQIDILDEVQTQVRNARISMTLKQNEIYKGGVDWSLINNVPAWIKPFDQSKILGLKYDQLDHKDQDHTELMRLIRESDRKNAIDYNVFNRAMEKRLAGIEKKLELIPYLHADLKNIGPDDHHAKFHSIESHIDTILMRKLKRLISGGIADDLHKHKIPAEGRGSSIVVGGIDPNDLVNEDLSSQCDGSNTAFTINNNIKKINFATLNDAIWLENNQFTKTAVNQITSSNIAPDSGEEFWLQYYKE